MTEPFLALMIEEGARATEGGWLLEAGQVIDFPIEPPEKNTTLPTLNFNPGDPFRTFE